MKNFVLAAIAAIVFFCPRDASAQSLYLPTLIQSPVTISAQCSTPTAGCSAGQFAAISLGGRNSVGVQVVTTNFTGTLAPYYSQDGGATWTAARLRQNFADISSNSNSVGSVAYAASTAQQNWSLVVPYGAVTDVMIASTAAVTNTATVQIAVSNTPPNPLPAIITLKGTQASGAIGTQDLKDAGRSFVVLGADSVTPAIAETVIAFSQNKAGTVTGSATTYAITSGKTLRLQSLACSFTAGATANRVRVALRLNTGGACIASSGLLMPAMELAPTYGTATAAEGGAYGEIPFPDGLELSGASWNICLSENATAAAGTLTCTLTGYEY